MKVRKILSVYFAFVFSGSGIGILIPHPDNDPFIGPVGAIIAAFGLTFFWFQFRPIVQPD